MNVVIHGITSVSSSTEHFLSSLFFITRIDNNKEDNGASIWSPASGILLYKEMTG